MSEYDVKKTIVKGLKILLIILISGVSVEYGNSNWYGAIGPLLVMLSNFLKHSKGIDLKLI